jgi:hypothetical protein
MAGTQKKAVLFAPFWRQDGHVGNHRVDRFVRWLSDEAYSVVIIRAGTMDHERHQAWGREITVGDPLGLHAEASPGTANPVSRRKQKIFRKLRGAVAGWVFNPDPAVAWARVAARRSAVVQATRGAAFILSSNPPESAHVGAWLLSRRTGVPHIVDMRDGWLDEPLKPLLRTSALRRWREGRMEARILRDAKGIQVTSDIWKKLLCDRSPAFAPKVQVLTNGYPQHTTSPRPMPPKGPREEFLLIHAGRFIGSRSTQSPDLLLEPLLHNLSGQSSSGVVQLIGPLSKDELAVIELFKARFAAIGWRIEHPGSVPRPEVLARLPKADGLLLLSASYAALPSKLFEYIPTGRPLFVATYKDSATWNVCALLPQATLIEIVTGSVHSGLGNQTPFYAKQEFRIPPEYCEQSLAQTFKSLLNI